LRRTLLAVLLIATLLLPTQAAAYNGIGLSRASVGDVSLVDQHGENVSLEDLSEDLLVVAFVFTNCPDACPVITHNIKAVQAGLPEELAGHVGFVSITVDPVRDTQERLLAFTEYHRVNWPHLTADNATLEDVWARFGVNVQSEVIEAHGAGVDFSLEGATVTIVNADGNASEHLAHPTGWNLTVEHADAAGWNITANVGQDGHMVAGIEGITSPEDGSWRWALQRWNSTSSAWEESPANIDDIDAVTYPHLAWTDSRRNLSDLPDPSGRSSAHVLFAEGNATSHVLNTTSAHLMTHGALHQASSDLEVRLDSQWGHFLEAIDGTPAPAEGSWYWRLALWNGTMWEESMVGMDDLNDTMHIAWSPSTVSLSDLPTPGASTTGSTSGSIACDGHGWVMGSGASAHCMCDEGYRWKDGDRMSCLSNDGEVLVGHNTVTFILDDMRKPRIQWAGDGWSPDDFTEDLVELAQDEGIIPRPERSSPSPSLAMSVVALLGAALLLERRRS
jgi:cytochrome oxidase Cu insertion factor (SCO1/SenC/PrrC family)